MKNLDKLKEYIPIKWRVQSANTYGANCVCYIDARDAMQRLDDVVGVGMWQRDHKEVSGVLYGGIGLFVNNQWVWMWDAGTESMTEKQKGESSDSFKRACVNIGIGRFMYDLPIVRLPTIEHNKKFIPTKEKENPSKMLKSGEALTKYINGYLPVLTGWDLQKLARTMRKPIVDNENMEALVEYASKSKANKDKVLYAYSLSPGQIQELNKTT